MADFIVAGVLIIMIGAAIVYIVKEKKKGTRCIGCPSAGQCPSAEVVRSKCSGAASTHAGCGCGCSK